MDTETARSLLEALALGAGVLWLLGAWFTVSSARQLAAELVEQVQVQAPAATIVRRVAEVVAKSIRGMPLQSCILESSTADAVRWRSQGALRYVAELAAVGDAKQSQVRLALVASSPLLVAARVVVGLGAVLIGVLYWLLDRHVVTSGQPGIRWQVVQMVQAIHLLWPPFLFVGLARSMRRRVVEEVRRVVQNSPFA
ncbi:MAG: hypothetical protein JNK49_07820 [Planctomycetes bacterium]|nr:hypothetical protein [Planctomycetota bacterium]